MAEQTDVSTSEMVDHPWVGSNDGHNCWICRDRDDALHLCWREAHPPNPQYEWFVRQVVEAINKYQDDGKALDLSPEDKIGRAMRLSWYMAQAGDDDFWTEGENAIYTAALCIVPMRED